MGKKLQSMDVTIHGITRSYEFDPAIPVSSDDEGEASLEVLEDAETTEVVLTGSGIASARVTVDYVFTYRGSVEVELDDVEGVDDSDDLQSSVESGDFYQVVDAITEDVSSNIDDFNVTIDSVEVMECFDEDGESIEF